MTPAGARVTYARERVTAAAIGMDASPRHRFDIGEAIDDAARNEVYRFRYRIYVEQMGLRQKHADHVRKRGRRTARRSGAHLRGLFQWRHRHAAQPIRRLRTE